MPPLHLRAVAAVTLWALLSAGCSLFTKDPTPEEAFFGELVGQWGPVGGPRDSTYSYRFSRSAPTAYGYTLEEISRGGVRRIVSAGTVTVDLIDGDPDAAVLTYAPTRGEDLPPDRAHLEREGRLLVLQGVDGGVPRSFEYVPSLFGRAARVTGGSETSTAPRPAGATPYSRAPTVGPHPS